MEPLNANPAVFGMVYSDGSTDPKAMHEWLNLAVSGGEIADEFATFGIPSLLEMPSTGVYTRGVGLDATWEQELEKFASEVVIPRMNNKTAVGVFLGDEICCHNSSCWHAQLYPLSAKLRALLGTKAILYENECGDSLAGGGMAHGHPVGPPLDKVAPDLDFISIDLYKGYLPSDDNGTAEAIAARAFVEKEGERTECFLCNNRILDDTCRVSSYSWKHRGS